MESIKDRVAIVGMGCTQFGEIWDKGSDDLIIDACYEAFEDAGIEPKDVQAAWLASLISGCCGTKLARALKLDYVPVTRVENFCAGGMDALRNACFGVASGVYDIALACGVEKTKDELGFGQLHPMSFASKRTHMEAAPMNMFAKHALAYFNRYGLSVDEGRQILAKIAVKNHHNGTLAPKAHLRREITEETVLSAPFLAYPFTLFDCCGMSDGGAAAIVTRPEIAKKMKKDYVLVKGFGLVSNPGDDVLTTEDDFTHFPSTARAAKIAYEQAGIKDPRKEISTASVHDCFTFTELSIYEDLGFSPEGRAREDIEAGRFTLEGEQPVNTDGGLKCFGHPLSASGLRMTYELYKQLQGKAGPRQIKNPTLGLAHNLGGIPFTCGIGIYGLPE